MRTAFNLHPITTTTATTKTMVAARSEWRTPVPYLFGGMATMLGFIAFALLILACSYCRHLRNDNNEEDEKSEVDVKSKGTPAFEEENKIVVIMAGDDKPSFLATPSALFYSKPIIASLDHILSHHHHPSVFQHAADERGSTPLDRC